MTNEDMKLLLSRRQLLATASIATVAMALPLSAVGAATNSAKSFGRSQPFNLGWQFRRGEGDGFEAPGINDADWRTVDLPHDWSIEDLPPRPTEGKSQVIGPFDSKAKGGTAVGFAIGGEGWYRKHFQLQAPAGGRVEILFEGAYMNSEVWLNGHLLGAHPNGYTPFAYDLTPHLAPDGNNVLAVRVRNLGENSRWYSGSGIYRHVWLDVLPQQARIARWGVGVSTQRVIDTGADIAISTRLEDIDEGLVLVSQIKDAKGRIVAENSTPATAEVKQTLRVSSPLLWSPEKPTLYTLETELRKGKAVIDRARNPVGIRVVAFDANKGMTVNGVSTKLRGGCIHHDNGLLGACAFDAAEERKVLLLKARGFNAVRPSHNPFSTAFLAACDRHGLFVIAETFDAWSEPKLPQDYSVHFNEHWRSDLETIVLSARNHPSIIMWSIGNEIPGRNSTAGVETQWNLANAVHRLDPTRPVTAAINGYAGRPVTPSEKTARAGAAGVADRTSNLFLDVVGYNYKLADYETEHQLFPQRVFFGTESFPKDTAAIWDLTEKHPWLIGDFVWTAIDYLGEAGIGGSVVVAEGNANNMVATMGAGWPWVNAACGDIDLIGQQNPPSLARDVIWGLSPLELAVQRPVPIGKVDALRPWGWHDEQRSWNWPDAVGKTLTVRVYTAGDRVELRLNGRVLESKTVAASDLKRVEFTAPYEPGVLEAVAFRNGVEIARKQLTTVGAPAAVRLIAERPKNGSGRGDVAYVGIEIVDAQGRVVPDAKHTVKLAISGPADLIAFGSASPFAEGSFQSPTANTFNGRALAILRGKGRGGRVPIEARAEGLRSGSVAVQLT